MGIGHSYLTSFASTSLKRTITTTNLHDTTSDSPRVTANDSTNVLLPLTTEPTRCRCLVRNVPHRIVPQIRTTYVRITYLVSSRGPTTIETGIYSRTHF